MSSPLPLSLIRRKLIKSIISLPSSASKDLVYQKLNEEIEQISSFKYSKENEAETSTVAPLIIACEQGQLNVIRYMRQMIQTISSDRKSSFKLSLPEFVSVFGHPLEKSDPDACGGNGASHIIASTKSRNCSEIYDALVCLLDTVMLCIDNDSILNDSIKALHEFIPEPSLHELLLCQQNENKDTAIMIGAATGNIQFLFHSLSQYTKKKSSTHLQSIRKILYMKNKKGDTALKLAFGHGYYDITKLFLYGEQETESEGTIRNLCDEYQKKENLSLHEVTSDLLRECEEISKGATILLGVLKSRSTEKDTQAILKDEEVLKKKMFDMKKCLTLIRITAEKNARIMETELLLLTEKEETKLNEGKSKQGKKSKKGKKKKKKRGKSPPYHLNESKDELNLSVENGSKSMNSDDLRISTRGEISSDTAEVLTQPRFTTLEDGTIVGNLVSKNLIESESMDDIYGNELYKEVVRSRPQSPPKDLKTLLRDRFRETINEKSSYDDNENLEQLMKSLCLDVSMLLLPPHGMAMALSPSQLDTVEQILKDQLLAVKKAKSIQDRILCKTKNEKQSSLIDKSPKL